MSDGGLLTSVLLLSPDGKRLTHGAAPNLPRAYRDSIDGGEIGPCAGSCGTAAFLDRPIYVKDIAIDPLWAKYRHLALPHGLKSCWSPPIHDGAGAVIGTFAIYHRTVGKPSVEEIEAIDMIADHVAQAIMWARMVGEFADADWNSAPCETVTWPAVLLQKIDRLETLATQLQETADNADSAETRDLMTAAALECRRLVSFVRHHNDRSRPEKQ